mmetsp:Transcript_8751/g.24904  ORF Transcript_8751/g.24904 Transcript_8751/m.24904 type:complete len:200 (+) Transcript_8751:2279-2878(+)
MVESLPDAAPRACEPLESGPHSADDDRPCRGLLDFPLPGRALLGFHDFLLVWVGTSGQDGHGNRTLVPIPLRAFGPPEAEHQKRSQLSLRPSCASICLCHLGPSTGAVPRDTLPPLCALHVFVAPAPGARGLKAAAPYRVRSALCGVDSMDHASTSGLDHLVSLRQYAPAFLQAAGFHDHFDRMDLPPAGADEADGVDP